LTTVFATILHEIPREIGDFPVLIHGGLSIKRSLLFNFLTAFAEIFWRDCRFAPWHTFERLHELSAAYCRRKFSLHRTRQPSARTQPHSEPFAINKTNSTDNFRNALNAFSQAINELKKI